MTLSGIDAMQMLLEPVFIHNLWFGEPSVTEPARHADGLFIWLFWFSTFWFVVLMAFMVFAVIRWRRRPGQPTPRSASHNTVIEVVWTVVPSLFLIYMFFAGFHGYMEKRVGEGPAIELSLEAYKWGWDITYPTGAKTTESTRPIDITDTALAVRSGQGLEPGGEGATGPAMTGVAYPIFYVPEDQPITLRMTSRDVIHSFWVPDFRDKVDIFPNRYTGYHFRTDELTDEDPLLPGPDGERGERFRDHMIYCAEYCGDAHSEMVGILRVVSRAKYESWVPNGGADFTTMPPEEAGRIIANTNGCFACHSVDGSRGTGPTWQNAWGYPVPLADGTEVDFDANYARTAIYTPGVQIHAGYPNQMVPYEGVINDQQLEWIIQYIQSLSDRDPNADQRGGAASEGDAEGATPEEGSTEDETAGEPAPMGD